MKKAKLFALGMLSFSLVFLTSCEDDEDSLGPSLTVTELGSGSTGADITIVEGEALTFSWDARKGDRDLEAFRVSLTGTNAGTIPMSRGGNSFPYDIANADDETYQDTLDFPNAGLNQGVTSYDFTVEDRDGNTTTVSFRVTVEASTSPLSSPQSFTWERVGGNDGTGLAQFGLAWTSNTATSAIVTTDAATKMVALNSGDWNGITTAQALAAAIDAGSGINRYEGVSSQQSGSYDDVLAVRHNGVDYLIQVQNGTVSTGGSGTTITITGQYKQS